MSTLISKATGNFNTAGTWALVDATSELDVETTGTSLGSGTYDTNSFVPGAITVDGIGIRTNGWNNAPAGTTGTLSAILRNSTDSVDVATVTIGPADWPTTVNLACGWMVFGFASVTLVAGKSYVLRLTHNFNQTIKVFASASNNFSRILRTTTTQAPVAGDKLLVAGEHTGNGTGNSFTVTMDNTATTSFGPTVSGGPPNGMMVNKRGTLTFSTSIAAYLKIKGILGVFSGGTLNIGTSGARIGASSSAILEFDSVVSVDSGLVVGADAVLNVYGNNGRTVVNTLMTADKAAAATVITLAATTGWQVSDELAFASTTQTASQCEKKTILTVDSATQVTLSAGLTNAHSGTSPTQAEVINLTRNVKIRGVSAVLCGYLSFATTSVVNIDYAEFLQLGSSNSGKRGIDVGTTTGTCIFTNNSLHDSTASSSVGFNIGSTSGHTLATSIYSNNVSYNILTNHLLVAGTSGLWLLNGNVGILSNSLAIFQINDAGSTFTNNTAVGSGSTVGISLNESSGNIGGVISGNTSHSNFGGGLITGPWGPGTIDTMTIWRNSNGGFAPQSGPHNQTFTNAVCFGNGNQSIGVSTCYKLLFKNCTFNGDTTFPTTTGLNFGINAGSSDILFEDCSFGVVSGIKTAHTQDVLVQGAASIFYTAVFRNCILASPIQVTTPANLDVGGYVRAQRLGQVAGSHKTWTRYGTISTDAVIFDALSPSIRLTPNNATNQLKIDGDAVDGKGAFQVAVSSGSTSTVSVRVRKSVAGDGTAYNGNLPRLILRKNVSAGIAADVVLATATAASVGAWETISGTTAAVTDDAVLSFVVDCDGTTGWVNVDTWVGTSKDTTGVKYWNEGTPYAAAGVAQPGVGNVRFGTVFNDGASTGTLVIPAVGDVQSAVGFGAAGTEFTGTFGVPVVGHVRSGDGYGAGGIEFTGTDLLPIVGDVRTGIQYGAAGVEFTGTYAPPACDYPLVGDVQDGVFYSFGTLEGTFVVPIPSQVLGGVGYGANGTEFLGLLSGTTPNIAGLSTELYHGVDDIIARLIWQNRGLGTDPTYWETAMTDPTNTHSWPVHSFGEPDVPDNCITVYETTPQFDAKLMITGEVYEHRGFTVRVRGKGLTKNTARRMAERIRADFNHGGCTDQDVTMEDGTVYFIPCVSRATLVPFGRDAASSQRWLVNLNCLAVILRRPS